MSDDERAASSDDGGASGGDHVEALRIQLTDYRQVVQNQQQRVNYIDRKAAKLSRFVLLVFGVIATGVGVFPERFPANALVLAGLAVLLVAFVFGVVAQSASELRTGSRARHGDDLLHANASEREWLEVLIADYSTWVEGNQLELSKSAFYLSLTQTTLIVGVVIVAAGLIVRVL